MYDAWVKSGCALKFTPTIDRIDSRKGYISENIQLITWAQNLAKGLFDRIKASDKMLGLRWRKDNKKWEVYLGTKYIGCSKIYDEAVKIRKSAEWKCRKELVRAGIKL